MSLVTQLQDLATRVATESKALRTLINGNVADLSSLTTTDKSNLVNALNELHGAIAAASGIDDASTTTTSSWSSQHTSDEISTAISNLVNGADAAYDTLKELQTAIQNDDSQVSSILTALANRLQVDAAQGLTSAQQLQGRQNLDVYGTTDIGDPTTDFVATFVAGLS